MVLIAQVKQPLDSLRCFSNLFTWARNQSFIKGELKRQNYFFSTKRVWCAEFRNAVFILISCLVSFVQAVLSSMTSSYGSRELFPNFSFILGAKYLSRRKRHVHRDFSRSEPITVQLKVEYQCLTLRGYGWLLWLQLKSKGQ